MREKPHRLFAAFSKTGRDRNQALLSDANFNKLVGICIGKRSQRSASAGVGAENNNVSVLFSLSIRTSQITCLFAILFICRSLLCFQFRHTLFVFFGSRNFVMPCSFISIRIRRSPSWCWQRSGWVCLWWLLLRQMHDPTHQHRFRRSR